MGGKRNFFSKQYGVNLFIEGVASTINTESLLADKFLTPPSLGAFSTSNIKNFTVIGNDIECYIDTDYIIKTNAFRNISPFISYNDIGGKCIEILISSFQQTFSQTLSVSLPNCLNAVGTSFYRNETSMREVYLDNILNIGGSSFFRPYLLDVIYMPRCLTLGSLPSVADCFREVTVRSRLVYAHPSLETSNGGGVEADIAYLIAQGATVRYVTDFTPPSAVSDLTSSNITATSVDLNLSTPASTTAIDYYQVWIDDGTSNRVQLYKPHQKITLTGDTVSTLITGTTYKIKIKTVDEFYNISEYSNEIEITTL